MQVVSKRNNGAGHREEAQSACVEEDDGSAGAKCGGADQVHEDGSDCWRQQVDGLLERSRDFVEHEVTRDSAAQAHQQTQHKTSRDVVVLACCSDRS